VDGNTIDGSTMAGIWLGPEFYWAEGGYPRNVTVRRNTINNVGYWGGQTAALVVAADQAMPQAGAFQNIVIDSNIFQNFNTTAMFLSGINGLTISNNILQNLQSASPYAVYNRGEVVPGGTLVYVTGSSSVQILGNTTSQLGSFNTGFVVTSLGTTATGVSYTTVVADSDHDFSGTQGANNWWYGYFPAQNVNAFTLLPWFNTSWGQWQHTTYGPPWTMSGANSVGHPNGANSGIEEWATRRWSSSVSGYARISGHLAKNQANSGSTGVYGRIYLNHVLIYERFVSGNDAIGVDYSVPVKLNVGDVLDFAVAANGVDAWDSTHFSAAVLLTQP
jgi:hypothetical protein